MSTGGYADTLAHWHTGTLSHWETGRAVVGGSGSVVLIVTLLAPLVLSRSHSVREESVWSWDARQPAV